MPCCTAFWEWKGRAERRWDLKGVLLGRLTDLHSTVETRKHIQQQTHCTRSPREAAHTFRSRGVIINPSRIRVVWVRASERRWLEKEKDYRLEGNTLAPLKPSLPSSFFFLWRVIFRFTILIMMILERRGGGRRKKSRGWWAPHAIVRPVFPLFFFLLLHIAWSKRERDRKRREGGLLND